MQKEMKPIQSLENWLLSYDRILFVKNDASEILAVVNRYPKKHILNKILLLKEKGINNGAYDKDAIDGKISTVDVIYIDFQTAAFLRRFYHTYEFSNKIRIASQNANFGAIWNYVRTGVLSPEEAVVALLK